MTDYLQNPNYQGALIATAVVLVLLAALLLRHLRSRRPTLERIVESIAYERLSDIVIPKADEGEIHIDHLVLTAQGLLVIDVKQVEGVVFGSDKMQEWTVIGKTRRHTFANPQPALYDRIAAVRQIVRQVPVAGRLVFLDGADFTKGVPKLVCRPDELLSEFGDVDKTGAAARIDAFKPHWELLRRAARNGETRAQRGRRASVLRS